jgi:hypothetical protein
MTLSATVDLSIPRSVSPQSRRSARADCDACFVEGCGERAAPPLSPAGGSGRAHHDTARRLRAQASVGARSR